MDQSGTSTSGVMVKAILADHSSGSKPIQATDPPYSEYHSDISPDGNFVAFDSGRTPKSVYIRRFPSTGARWQISPSDGEEPHYSRDGKEVYFYSAGALWAAPVTVANGRVPTGMAKQLFKVALPPLLRNRMAVCPTAGSSSTRRHRPWSAVR
jgi:Tol biopolymer transport system component